VLVGAAAAWRAHAGDGWRTLEERVAALEARVADHDAKLAALAEPTAPTQPTSTLSASRRKAHRSQGFEGGTGPLSWITRPMAFQRACFEQNGQF
jgi:hypothetical protein